MSYMQICKNPKSTVIMRAAHCIRYDYSGINTKFVLRFETGQVEYPETI